MGGSALFCFGLGLFVCFLLGGGGGDCALLVCFLLLVC